MGPTAENPVDDRCRTVLQPTEGPHGHVDLDRLSLDAQFAKRVFDVADADESA